MTISLRQLRMIFSQILYNVSQKQFYFSIILYLQKMVLDFLVPDIGVYNDDDESGGEEIEEGSDPEIEGK